MHWDDFCTALNRTRQIIEINKTNRINRINNRLIDLYKLGQVSVSITSTADAGGN